METERGKIVNIADGKVIVQVELGEQCKLCGAAQACLPTNETTRQLELPYANQDVKVGDRVEIGYKSQTRVISAFLVFLLPIILLISGYFIGLILFKTESTAILFSFIGLIFSFILLKILNSLFSSRRNFIPTIVTIENQLDF